MSVVDRLPIEEDRCDRDAASCCSAIFRYEWARADMPAEKTKQLLGVVIEVQVASGVDYLAAYANRSAR